jgi:hypothetical protein
VGFVHAQGNPNLSGLQRIQLTIRIISDGDKACIVPEALVRNAAMYPASSAKFAIVQDKAQANLQIGITIYGSTMTNRCAVNISFGVVSFQMVQFDYSGKVAPAGVLLFDRTNLLFSDPISSPDEIKSTVEDMTKSFITEWNLQNR